MKTIARTATRKIAAIKATIVSVTFYDQRDGGTKPTTLDAAFRALHESDFARLVDNENGTFNVNVHSNLWFVLYTQAALDRITAEKTAREQQRATRTAGMPAIRTETREQRRNRIMASTTSIHDLGRTTAAVTGQEIERVNADELRVGDVLVDHQHSAVSSKEKQPDGTVVVVAGVERWEFPRPDTKVSILPRATTATTTVTCTRKAMGTQIAEACETLGIALDHSHSRGISYYVVHGQLYTASELADLVLENGFTGSFGAKETRVRLDSPVRPAAVARRKLVEDLPESYTAEEVAEMSDDEAIIAAVSSKLMTG